ncbi:hypothetical protein LTR91_004946 [Friedmanniomyces endolithicus]|uniref:Uncharacterized protein n=1 Tax=Friedmanniomyces endolithicus TaxID=329885 RepID=A0AAN6FUL7_9PEZI|nr:hypothetical protein LTS09_012398 [Friedmanniomyces endolithicus]KAK0273675.1 hypothetical protein LTR35_012112 [Friedmanniomyces endolithicus]KAK0284364.1 hypothetical protein LTS00_011321 [Friedmanniomyces endolithicus]KAK0323125.1 hypothetical protein LTR82_006056 [Friedmanniomyces endolithicus]KAK0922272.1 hypothetical protein LTR57_007960 [Friedmanniomyces endolithicus]
MSAPTAINPAAQSTFLDRYAREPRRWTSESEQTPSEHPSQSVAHADSTYPSASYERHIPVSGGKYGPQQLTSTSPHHLPGPGAWRSLHHDDRREGKTINADAPLTLHIPKSHVYTVVKTEGQSFNKGTHTPSQPGPSLPSFATFREHATRSDGAGVNGPETVTSTDRLPCFSCSKLKPMVHEVAVAAAELDENVQSHFNKAVVRKLEVPSDTPERTVRWVLERLRLTKQELADAACRVRQPAYFFPHPPAPTGLLSRPSSPRNTLKRPAEWSSHDNATSKRPRSGDSPESQVPHTIYDRRASIDFPTRNIYSPQQTESAPLSAYPRTLSPSLAGRPLRPLPSPSSLAYPNSAATSLPPPTVHPGSPAPSYQASASIHTTSTNSVTSAHIADLQHQVTLKSLSLQTLQSEYSSLLQKLQRERVKSQTIEKKTTVSEQEVNDLTGRTEDLAEQVKNLEQQLEESERKRDSERADTAKEKEQWSRMLDMSNRLQGKLAAERQTAVEERDALKRRAMGLADEVGDGEPSPIDASTAAALTTIAASGVDQHQRLNMASQEHAPGDVTTLNREVGLLKTRVDTLVAALEEAKRKNLELGEHSRGILQRSNDVGQTISRALDGERYAGPEQESAISDPTAALVRQDAKMTSYPAAPPALVSTAASPPKLAPLTKSAYSSRPALPTPTSATAPSIAEMASAGRAVSPGPEELGITVQQSTSSPEELIEALGPITAPLSTFQFQPTSTYAPTYSQARRHSYSPADAGPRGFTNSSAYRQSPYTTTQRGKLGWPAASPSSDNSSPDSTRDEDSPPLLASSTKRRSPDLSSLSRPREDSASSSQGRVLHMEPQGNKFPHLTTPAAAGLAGFRPWSHDARSGDAAAAMPPPPRPSPPRPSPGLQAAQFGQTSGV